MNVSEAINGCLNDLSSIRASNTVRTYRNGLDYFCAYLSERGISPDKSDAGSLTSEIFSGFVTWIGKQSIQKATAGIYVAGMKRLFRWLMANDVVSPTPNEITRYQDKVEEAKYRKGEKFSRTPVKGYLEKILSVVDKINEPEPRKSRDVALILFLSSTGLRNNEVRSLLVKDVDLSSLIVYVKTTKGDKPRKVYLSHEAATALRDYWAQRGYANKNDPIFCRHDKGAGKGHGAITTTTVRNVVDDVVALAGIEPGQWSPHYFRHAFAIKALAATGNLALVQDLLGHASPQSTRIYAKIYDEDLEAAYRHVFDK